MSSDFGWHQYPWLKKVTNFTLGLMGVSPGHSALPQKVRRGGTFKNTISTILTDMVDSFTDNILYGLFQCVASKFPPKLGLGAQERALVILNFEFRGRRTFRGRAEFRRGGDQPERQLLHPWVLKSAKF